MHLFGDVAQMVERALRMREVGGSMPPVSTELFSSTFHFGSDYGTSDVHVNSIKVDPFILNAKNLYVYT